MASNINVSPQFILAGEATFTVSNGQGSHYTYHVYRTEPSAQFRNPAWFIKALTGPDNTQDYQYMGMLVLAEGRDPKIKITARSGWTLNEFPFKVAEWALRVIWQVAAGRYSLPPTYSIKHDGNCGRCGRKLTTPASLDTGLGPECAAMMGIPWEERSTEPELDLEVSK